MPATTKLYRYPPPLEVKAGQYLYNSFAIGHFTSFGSPPCRLTGRVIGLAGGNKDVDVLVLDEAAFSGWQEGKDFTAVFEEYQTSDATLDISFREPGEFYVVVSNRFSIFTTKTVHADIEVTCGNANSR